MKTELKNGSKAFLILGAYFMAIESFGMAHSSFLRFLNFIILGYFVNQSIFLGLKRKQGFLNQFGSAVFTSFIAVFLSTFALIVYISLRGQGHIETLASPLLVGGSFKLNVGQFAFGIFAEGFASGMILSFILMQYWKNRTVTASAPNV